jgi:D-serine deaminase-like pyridoxal phosphate-dependent protein
LPRAILFQPGRASGSTSGDPSAFPDYVAGLRATAGPLRVLVELDSGARRSGVANSAAALEVARHAREAGLEVIGVFTPGGHGYRAPGAGPSAAADEVAILGDRQQFVLGAIPAEGIAVAVATTVVSVAVDGQVVLDAGAKTLTKDRAPFLDGFGAIPAYPDAVIERLFDYHAAVRVAPGAPAPRLGEVVAVVPNHVCPVVEQFYDFVVARAGLAEGRWPVDARGRSR